MAVKKIPKVKVKVDPSDFEKAQDREFGKQGSSLTADTGRFFSTIGRNLGSLGNDIHKSAAKTVKYQGSFLAPGAAFIAAHSGGANVLSTARRTNKTKGPTKKPTGGPGQPSDEEQMSPEESEKSFMDYLAQAQGLVGGGVDYSPEINNLKQQAGVSDARLAAMYKQLQGSYAADAPVIGGNFDTAKSAQLANAQQAAAQTAQGYSSARDAQSKQLSALGIGDAAAVLASNGGNAARDAAVANSNIAQNQLANVNQTDANKASALTYNTQIGQAAGAEGASQRATLQNSLAAKLAELQTAQTQANSQGRSSAIGLAGQLADFDNAAAQRRAAANDPMAQIEAQQAAANLVSTQLKNQNYAAAQGGGAGVGSNLATYQKLAVKYGVDPADSTAFANFVKLVNSTK